MWRIRTNQELSELYKTPDLVPDIRRRGRKRLEGFWRGIRMDQTAVAHRIFESKPKGTRPRIKWLLDEENDYRS
jgi:truncated hemoglobin YjbI